MPLSIGGAALYDQSSDGILILVGDEIVYANAAMNHLFYFDFQKVIPAPLTDLPFLVPREYGLYNGQMEEHKRGLATPFTQYQFFHPVTRSVLPKLDMCGMPFRADIDLAIVRCYRPSIG